MNMYLIVPIGNGVAGCFPGQNLETETLPISRSQAAVSESLRLWIHGYVIRVMGNVFLLQVPSPECRLGQACQHFIDAEWLAIALCQLQFSIWVTILVKTNYDETLAMLGYSECSGVYD